jgi:hypothetical protein
MGEVAALLEVVVEVQLLAALLEEAEGALGVVVP